LLREVCFSAVLINGGLGASSQMRNLNAMYRRLLLRGNEDTDTTSPHQKKRPAVIKTLSPIQALTYLSQAERAANVGSDFVSEQTFAGGQGASSRTYAVDSIEVQIEKAQKNVDEASKKEAEARRRRAKAHWHLALELITTGSLIKNKQAMKRASTKISSLWKWRSNNIGDTRGWRPTATFIQSIQRKFPWADPNTLQLINVPSQVTADEISIALLNAFSQEFKIQSKLLGLTTKLAKAKTEEVRERVQKEISDAETELAQAINNDKKLQAPVVTSVKMSADSWTAFAQVSDKKMQDELIRLARSTTGIALTSKETAPHIQSAIDKAAEKSKQAEATFKIHPCAKNKEEQAEAQKRVDKARAGLRIIGDSSVLSSVKLHVIMSVAARSRGLVHKTKTALFESVTASIALANETLGKELPRLKDNQSNLDRLMRVLEKQGMRSNYHSQKSGSFLGALLPYLAHVKSDDIYLHLIRYLIAFDTLEALRTKEFYDTFCPICQLTFGENAGDNPHLVNPIAAMISCGHFFCIKCLEHVS
jgi:ribosome-binding factor A